MLYGKGVQGAQRLRQMRSGQMRSGADAALHMVVHVMLKLNINMLLKWGFP
jgi:hypothetical protein